MKISQLITHLNREKNNNSDINIVISSKGIDGFGGYMSDDIKFSLVNYEDEDFLSIDVNHNLYTNRKKKSAIESKEQVHEYARLELKKWADKSGDEHRTNQTYKFSF